jgi:DNA-binding CsgD family transcriptional regulator
MVCTVEDQDLQPERKMKGSVGLSQAEKAILNLMLIS